LTELITVERDGHVLLIGVNRPAKRNAVNLAAMDALCGAYELLGTDDQLRAGMLFAHGDHFSAGHRMGARSTASSPGRREGQTVPWPFSGRFLRSADHIPWPA
jgi:enoyl-CoA hydratase/carnithine racemase